MQTRSAETLLGAAEKASPLVVRLVEEHHPQPAETSPASHQGAPPRPVVFRALIWFKAFLEAPFCCSLLEAAGAGRACRAAKGPSPLGAEGAPDSAGAAGERHGEDEEQQPRLHHVLREVGLGHR